MSKVANYLQEHLVGEVITGTDARHYFATDGSILQLAPTLIVYPRSENDVRKAARFSWQLAERGRIIPITSRGSGTNQTGAAIGSGMIIVFTAHMNRILELDSKSNTVIVEPGINFGRLQQTLHTHGRFLPAFPPSYEYSSVGGAIAENASGEKSVKYGDINLYTKSLRVVLANGEVIETKRLSKRELSKKLGIATFEGEIYRSIDTLLEEQQQTLSEMERATTKNNVGYNLLDVRNRDGSFDLTPLIAGSQGTLGIITEAVMATEPYNPQTTLINAQFDSVQHLEEAVLELRALPDLPSAMEMVDQSTLQQVNEQNPNQLNDIVQTPLPLFNLLIEFDNSERTSKKVVKKATKIMEKYAQGFQVSTDPEEQMKFRKLREITSMLLAHNDGLVHSLPMFDAAVPPDRLREYIDGVYNILSANKLRPALWGHIGDANIFVQPRLNLGHVGDRQKVFKVMEAYNKLVLDLNGTISASSGEGRLRAPYVEAMYGNKVFSLLKKVKSIFDPYNTLNPGVKFGTTLEDIRAMTRQDFDLEHLYDHLPRS
jgi:FAD/FMN-containing dehydrogenase